MLPNGEDERGALVCEGLDELNASIARWMEVNEPYMTQVAPIERSLDEAEPIQMMLCGPVDRMREAEAHLLRDPRITNTDEACAPGIEIVLHRTEYPQRDLCILDILPAGCSKASALLHLAELRGIKPSEILAIGDNWNDRSDVPGGRSRCRDGQCAGGPAGAGRKAWVADCTLER